MRAIALVLSIFILGSCNLTTKPTSGYLNLERQYYSRENPDSIVGSFTRKLYFNDNYSLLTIADSSATADDHLYIRDYNTNRIYLKKTFDSLHYYANFPIEKNHSVTYTGNTKRLHGYECKEGMHVGQMNDTTNFWATNAIGLDRTIWSLVDVDGFVLEATYSNGIKKVVKNIHFELIDDSFFKKQIEKVKTYKKETYHGLKIVEANWELSYYKGRLEAYRKQYENKELSKEKFDRIEQDFKTWFKDIEDRLEELKEKEKMKIVSTI